MLPKARARKRPRYCSLKKAHERLLWTSSGKREHNSVRAKIKTLTTPFESPLSDRNFMVGAKSSLTRASSDEAAVRHYGFRARSLRCASSIFADQSPRSL